MPVPLIQKAILDGLETVPNSAVLLKLLPVLLVLYLIRRWFQGAPNTSERTMHGKVVMITGGTSGIGAEVARDLATRGAQLVLLTQHALDDFFLVSYIEELRDRTNNELITAAHVDLSSLHSIRQFATKWVDNAPPRRLDMIILCANTMTPKGGKIETTNDDVEINWGLNYLANFHLLSILSPAIRAQPPDRDVRIIMATCSSYIGGSLPVTGVKEAKIRKKERAERFDPYSAYASSKLALMTFAQSFQKHLSAYARPDKNPMNAHVIIVDPGQTRTPGMRRYLSWGSLTGLVLYLLCYPLWYIILKSPAQGAQSFLYAAMEAQWGRGNGGPEAQHATLLPRSAVPAVVFYPSEGLPDPRPAPNEDYESATASPKSDMPTRLAEHLYRVVPTDFYRNTSEKLPSRKAYCHLQLDLEYELN
ncbi:NAD(P)-binding protein [Aureobasidium pullulans]|nr:NAD(P)-binding protein [Aureobasidium pullulans]